MTAMPSSLNNVLDFPELHPMFLEEMPTGESTHESLNSTAMQGILAMMDEESPETLARNLKESGNDAMKLGGSKRLDDAIEYYSQAIDRRPQDSQLRAQCLSNRALAHLKRGNYGKCIADSLQAIDLSDNKRDASSVCKMYFRAAAAALKLGRCREAVAACISGLKLDSEHKHLRELLTQCRIALTRQRREEQQVRNANRAEFDRHCDVVQACRMRGIQLVSHTQSPGESNSAYDDGCISMRQDYDQARPYVDESGALHWPVIILIDQYRISEFVQDWLETISLREMLTEMFPLGDRIEWDLKGEYSIDNIVCYVEDPATSKRNHLDLDSTLLHVLVNGVTIPRLTMKPVLYIAPISPTPP